MYIGSLNTESEGQRKLEEGGPHHMKDREGNGNGDYNRVVERIVAKRPRVLTKEN